jgi:hypothetical protein
LFISRGILKRSGNESGATHCRLFFDEENDALGIRLLDGPDAFEADSIRDVSVERSGVAINILPLLRYYNFPVPHAKVVLPVTFDNDMVVVNIQGLRERKAAIPPPPPVPAPPRSAPPMPPRVQVTPPQPRRAIPPPPPPPSEPERDFDDDIPF